MSMQPSLRLVLLWHMHQPDFRDQDSGEFQQPWVYLHALKDYSDMAAHLEAHPGVQAVVNLVPILLDQIDDYADQFRTGRLRDPLLRLLVHETGGEVMEQRPERAVAVAVVIELEVLRPQIDGRETDAIPGEDLGRRGGIDTRFTTPAEPCAARVAQCGEQANGQAARRRSAAP